MKLTMLFLSILSNVLPSKKLFDLYKKDKQKMQYFDLFVFQNQYLQFEFLFLKI